MRLDVYLKAVCILRSRSLAKEACTRGKITVNDEPGKASRTTQPGDRIRLVLGPRILEIEVVDIPSGQVSKKAAGDFFRVLVDQRDPELP